MRTTEPGLLSQARQTVITIEASETFDQPDAVILHVGTSEEFARAHPPGARWAPRGWLERDIQSLAPEESTPLIIVCESGRQSLLAAQTMLELGRLNVSAIAGGMGNWHAAGLPIEYGLTGVLAPPNDILTFGPQRGYADMQHYLRWETALGEKYVSEAQ